MSVFLTAALAAARPVELGPPWAEFSQAPANTLRKTMIEVGTLGYDRAHDQLDFWLRRTVVSGIEHKEDISWADTRTCPSARPLLASMRDIPVPKFAPVGSAAGPPLIIDGVTYSLKADSDQGVLAEETNLGTPVAAWIERALTVLDPCWVTAVPKRTQ